MFQQCVKKCQNLIYANYAGDGLPHVIIGLSGGPDSIFLINVLYTLHTNALIKLTAAHLNHGWRQTSDEDASFCQKLAQKLNIEIIIKHAKDFDHAIKKDGSQEAFGRALRRAFFKSVHKEYTAHVVALAHHQDDQQETFFIKLARGASLDGLVCMKEIDDIYVRPLLGVTKKEILTYLHTNNIDYVIDHTNQSDDYLRNRIRKYLIPALEKCDARFSQKIISTIQMLHLENEFIQKTAQQAYSTVFIINLTTGKALGNLTIFNALNGAIAARVITHWLWQEKASFSMSKKFIDEIFRFLHTKRGGKHCLTDTWSIIKKKNNFWIESAEETSLL